jgi:hypothetical protein
VPGSTTSVAVLNSGLAHAFTGNTLVLLTLPEQLVQVLQVVPSMHEPYATTCFGVLGI